MRSHRRSGGSPRGARPTAAVLGALLLCGGVAGCSGGSGGSDSGGASAGDVSVSSVADESAGEAEAGGGQDGSDRRAGGTAARTGVQTRQVISVGSVTLEAEELGAVRDGIDQLLGRFGGYVTDEQTTNDAGGDPERSVLVLRLPAPRFEQAMAAFKELATVTHTDREATDVTTEVIDVAARIRTQEVSLQRLRKFLGEARDVNAMIRLESEIAERESDLGSLRAQQEFLDDQTSLSTINVEMNRTGTGSPQDDPLANAGFMTGLHNGWQAMLDILTVAFTVLGALTPFAVVLALLGVPGWLWYRTTRRRRAAPAAPAAPAA